LTDAGFQSRSVNVDSIDSAGIHSGTDLIHWNDILEIAQAVNPPAGTTVRHWLLFRNGDRLSGEANSFNGDTLQWNSPRLGRVGFSVDLLLGILPGVSGAADVDQTRTDDVIRLANGDTMHGIINAISPAGVAIQVGDATPTLGWDAVGEVLFSSPPGGTKGSGRRMFRVRLAGDESVTAADVVLSGGKVTLTFADKSVRTLDVASVAGIEQVNGPITWLTSLRPAENIYRPMFAENFPARFDRTVGDGRLISEKFPGFHHGIGCHSYSKLVYDLDGGWEQFRSQFAIDSDSPLADVTVRIYLDDKVAMERKNVKAGRVYPATAIPLNGAKTISLEVDYGENYATEDRFVWLDPALVKKAAGQ
jgi:hypothetical protein